MKRIFRAILVICYVFLGILLLSSISSGIPHPVNLNDPPTFSFSNFLHGIVDLMKGYGQGDFGELYYMGQHSLVLPVVPLLGRLVVNSFGNLICGLLSGVLAGFLLSLLATRLPRLGKLLDRMHLALLGIPDFFIVTLLQIIAIQIAKTAGHKVFTIMQVGDDVPFLIPFLVISILPGLLIYGTMRIALVREFNSSYVSTARSKGLTQNSIFLLHILRNTVADLLAVLPKTVSAAISSLVIVEVMSNIFGLGGYALNPSLFKVTSLPLTCAILASVALFAHGGFSLANQKFLIKHEGGGNGTRTEIYTKRDARKYRIAWFLFLLLVVVVADGSLLMPHSITNEAKIGFQQTVVNGVTKYITPPFPPSSQFLLGTDHRGYDLLSLLLNGAQYTLGFALAVTVFRFLLALPLGLWVGLTKKGARFVSTLQLVTTAVPLLLFVYPTLYGLSYMTQSPPGSKNNLIYMLILFGVLVLLGSIQLVNQFAQRAGFYRESLFLMAARTMGASNRRLIFRHVLPLLQSEIFFSGLIEFVQVLILMGQLAVLEIFIGGGEYFGVTVDYILPLTTTGEWGGMIAYSARTAQFFPWIAIATGAFFTTAVWILMYFSTQVQKRMWYRAIVRQTVKSKTRRVWVSVGVACVAIVLLVILPKQTTFGLAKPIPPNTSKQTSAVVPSQTDQDAVAKKFITKNVNSFMTSLASGKWEEAGLLLDIPKTPPQPFPPFDEWMNDLTKKGYHYVGVKQVVTPEVPLDPYQVELDVTDNTGMHITWTLQESGQYIVTGKR